MKVLLLRPKPDPRTIGLQHVMVVEPLELLYVGAVLNHDHTVVLYDMILEKQSLEKIILMEQPDVVAMSGYIAHVGIIKDYARRIRSLLGYRVTIIVGGVHAEVVPEDFLESDIDHILAANGLEKIQDILSHKENKLSKGPTIHKDAKRFTEPPLPARALAKRYQRHYYYMFHRPCALVKASYGCPYNCSFCFCKAITDNQYVPRDIYRVVDEIAGLDVSEIYIVDDDFLYNVQRLETFIHEVKTRGIKKQYLVYGRADFIAANPELLARLKKIGLRAVIVGLESALDRELDAYNKGSAVSTSLTALNVLKSLDIDCYGTFIVGLDWTANEFKALYRFIHMAELQFINLQPLTPMPGTPIFKTLESSLDASREDYYLWDMAHAVIKPKYMSYRQFYWQIVKIYYRITLRPKFTLRALFRYPLKENFSLLIGANRVMFQYLSRIVRNKA